VNAERLLALYERIAEAPDAVARLRRFVLDLAVRGKLTDFARGSYAVHPLGSMADFIMGQAPPGPSCNDRGEGTLFVKVGEFGDRFPIEAAWTTAPQKFAQRGDVLVCVVGATIGKLNLGIDCAIGRSVAAIRPSSLSDSLPARNGRFWVA
jgi:type I restriction enzyme S subunit